MIYLLFICVALFISVVIFKLYYKLSIKWNRCYTCLVGKTVIITGANTGIGYTAALDFAMRGARVILACRNAERAEIARRKIVQTTGNENVVVKVIDLASFESVRNFARDINANEQRVDILVNNAGSIHAGNFETVDGLQITMQINHFSPFLLTHLLIRKLEKSAPSRIVNVSSFLAKSAKLDVHDMNKYPDEIEDKAEGTLYANTKLCNILFTLELAIRLDGTGITANCLHPGVVATDIMRSYPYVLRTVTNFILKTFFMTQEEGAQTTIYVAVCKELEEVSGGLFANCERIELYDIADNVYMRQESWKESEDFVQLTDEERL